MVRGDQVVEDGEKHSRSGEWGGTLNQVGEDGKGHSRRGGWQGVLK